jgi:hypothetical protein
VVEEPQPHRPYLGDNAPFLAEFPPLRGEARFERLLQKLGLMP